MGHPYQMSLERQYLDWHGNQWRVRIKVPERLRDILGRSKLVHPLHTPDLKIASVQKWPHVTRFKSIVDDAQRALNTSDPLEAEALRLRLQADDEDTQYVIHERATRLAANAGHTAAQQFYELASGKATPLDHHAAAFLKHHAYKKVKSESDFHRVLGWLTDYQKSHLKPVTIEAITRKAAGAFIQESLVVGRGRDKATAYLGFLRTYWRWLQEKGHLTQEDPWAGQTVPKERRPDRSAEPDGGKRHFTDKELLALLNGPAPERLKDLMRIAALSGMRIEEICELRVEDCLGDTFRVRDGKTANAARTVPIHKKLVEIIGRRTKDKQPKDWLIDDLPKTPASREDRSAPASKQFTRYRRLVKVDERPNGKAKSNVDFHSFRRWFIRKARDAKLQGTTGFDERTLVWVVGHVDSARDKSLDLSQMGYAGQDPETAKRALVESVKLPTSSPSTPEGNA